MNSMLEKESQEAALRKKQKRRSVTVQNVPSTIENITYWSSEPVWRYLLPSIVLYFVADDRSDHLFKKTALNLGCKVMQDGSVATSLRNNSLAKHVTHSSSSQQQWHSLAFWRCLIRQCPHLHQKQESIYWTFPCFDEGNDSLLQNSPKTNMYCTYHMPTATTQLSLVSTPCDFLRPFPSPGYILRATPHQQAVPQNMVVHRD